MRISTSFFCNLTTNICLIRFDLVFLLLWFSMGQMPHTQISLSKKLHFIIIFVCPIVYTQFCAHSFFRHNKKKLNFKYFRVYAIARNESAAFMRLHLMHFDVIFRSRYVCCSNVVLLSVFLHLCWIYGTCWYVSFILDPSKK